MTDWMSRADWASRSEEFGPLEEHTRGVGERFVAMTLRSPGIDDPALCDQLWDLWLSLPAHRYIFEPIAPTPRGELLVKYAAIDWTAGAMRVDDDAVPIATLGIELTRAFEFIAVCVGEADLGWFACPFVRLDLEGAPRVGFSSPAGSVTLMNRVAPEVLPQWPRCDARALVFAIGQLMLGLVKATSRVRKTPFGQVLMQCLEPDPKRRIQTLGELRFALSMVGGSGTWTFHGREWKHVEQAIGYALLGQPQRALDLFEIALGRAPGLPLALAGRSEMILRGAKVPERQTRTNLAGSQIAASRVVVPQARTAKRLIAWQDWTEVRPVARSLVEAGRFGDAIALYLSTLVTPENQTELHLAIADCHLLAREYGIALDYAQRVLDREPANVLAHELRSEARYKRREYEQALDACAEWMAVAPDDGRPHYLRAKVLLALGWFTEARDACARATELTPKHLPAMLLRLHLDRSIKRVRAAAGKAVPVPIDLPEHLRDLRELLVTGRNAEAIEILERPEYATDTQAQLLRADLLLFSDRLDDALVAFEKTDGLAGKLGQATVLVRMRRFEDALTLCDAMVREHPTLSEPHEARAAALQALGRLAEADEAYKRALAADTQKSNARVRLGRG